MACYISCDEKNLVWRIGIVPLLWVCICIIGPLQKRFAAKKRSSLFKSLQQIKSLADNSPLPLSAKECWEVFFSSGPVIKKNCRIFGGKAFSEAAICVMCIYICYLCSVHLSSCDVHLCVLFVWRAFMCVFHVMCIFMCVDMPIFSRDCTAAT